MKARELLEDYKKQGTLFHGSNKDFDGPIKPNKSTCLIGDQKNLQTGIYATDNIDHAIIKAIVPKMKKGAYEYGIEIERGETVLYTTQNVIDNMREGWVYVVNPDLFERFVIDQYVAKTEVSVLDKIHVFMEDLKAEIVRVEVGNYKRLFG